MRPLHPRAEPVAPMRPRSRPNWGCSRPSPPAASPPAARPPACAASCRKSKNWSRTCKMRRCCVRACVHVYGHACSCACVHVRSSARVGAQPLPRSPPGSRPAEACACARACRRRRRSKRPGGCSSSSSRQKAAWKRPPASCRPGPWMRPLRPQSGEVSGARLRVRATHVGASHHAHGLLRHLPCRLNAVPEHRGRAEGSVHHGPDHGPTHGTAACRAFLQQRRAGARRRAARGCVWCSPGAHTHAQHHTGRPWGRHSSPEGVCGRH